MYRDRNEVHEFSQWVNSMSQDFMTGALTFRDENKNPITNGYAVIMDWAFLQQHQISMPSIVDDVDFPPKCGQSRNNATQ